MEGLQKRWMSLGMGAGLSLGLLLGVEVEAARLSALLNDGLTHTLVDDTYSGSSLWVRNVGCGSVELLDAACPISGAPTGLQVEPGGSASSAILLDSSWLMLDGGVLGGVQPWDTSTVILYSGVVASSLFARDFSTVTVAGGSVNGGISGGRRGIGLEASGASSVTLSGGSVGGDLYSDGTATLTLVGHDFALNGGAAVPYGQLGAWQGRLTGTLAAGDVLDNRFYQVGGRIVLAATPSPPLPVADILLNDTGSYVIGDWAYSRSSLHVRNLGCGDSQDPASICLSPGPPTLLELAIDGASGALYAYDSSSIAVSGGRVGTVLGGFDSAQIELSDGRASALEARGESMITLAGGVVNVVNVFDSASFALNSGAAEYGVFAYDAALVTLTGGNVRRAIELHDQSTAKISGGVVSRSVKGLGTSALSLSGGSVYGIAVSEFSTASVNGGTLRTLDLSDASSAVLVGGSLEVSFGNKGRLWVQGSSSLTLVGHDFVVDGAAVPYGAIDATSGMLTGVLQASDPLDVSFSRSGGRIVLADTVPAPALSPAQVLLNGGGSYVVSDWRHARDSLFVRDLGCGSPRDPAIACPAPGAPMTLELSSGGAVAFLGIYDSSELSLGGGVVGMDLEVHGAGFALLDGVEVAGRVQAYDAGRVQIDSGGVTGVLVAHDSSEVEVRGGRLDTIFVHDAASFAMSGGVLRNYLDVSENGRVTMSGGIVEDAVELYDHSSFTMMGGSLEYDCYVYDDASAFVSGGSLKDGITVYDSATAFVSGGTLVGGIRAQGSARVSITGGDIPTLTAREFSSISLRGSGFSLDGSPVGFGALAAESGQLGGTLESGDALDATFSRDPGAVITLVPEPALALLQWVAGLGVGLLRWGRKRR